MRPTWYGTNEMKCRQIHRWGHLFGSALSFSLTEGPPHRSTPAQLRPFHPPHPPSPA